MKKLTRGQVALITIVLVLIVDQAVKIWVKTHMYIGESIRVTDWFYIAFIENNGMAFGMEVGSKLFLSLVNFFISKIKRFSLLSYLKKIRPSCFLPKEQPPKVE